MDLRPRILAKHIRTSKIITRRREACQCDIFLPLERVTAVTYVARVKPDEEKHLARLKIFADT
jgi:hypothetical protein